jgi:hypothetical protein
MHALSQASWLPVGFVWDNVYLVGGGKQAERELSERRKLAVLKVLAEGYDEVTGELDIKKTCFLEEVCTAARLLDAWVKSTYGRFGDVARKSNAMDAVVASLESRGGFQKLRHCAVKQIPPHGTTHENPGIAECRALYQELARCKSSGLPPPAVLPTEDGNNVALPAQKSATASSPTDEDVASSLVEAQALAQEESLLYSLGASDGTAGKAVGVSDKECAAYKEAVSYLEPVKSFVDKDLFVEAASSAVKAMRAILVNDQRTSIKSAISEGIQTLATIAGTSGHQNFRMLTFLGCRYDIVSEVTKKATATLPSWLHVIVPYHSAELITAGYSVGKVSMVLLSLPPQDKQEQITAIVKYSPSILPGEKVRFLCLKENCPYRKGAAPPAGDSYAEIAGEAKDSDFLDACIAEAGGGEEDTLSGQAEDVVERLTSSFGAGASDQTTEQGSGLERKLFPIAATAMSYRTLYEKLGVAADARVLVAITSTAHPSIYMAARFHSMGAIVFQKKVTEHARNHGAAMALTVRLAATLGPCDSSACATSPSRVQYMRLPAASLEGQVISPFEISRGPKWYEGINKNYSSEQINSLVPTLAEKELDRYSLSLTPVRETFGRGLLTQVPRYEKSRVCAASALCYDSEDNLLRFFWL